ncbi:hypothetical protein [Acinetobacter guillouiae]|uniref:Uncharacterized protein n=1 Tax=Acinetobacter guillouiae NIPH 991 TaxID=1217656 RepID=N8WWU1_ACIGI|nr:hypothetical protein [Acinetobacter guillouiae]ENV16436.1 hypothetical protein F964_03371 [Acinetobacter guillouiae NIPH 991]
MNEEVQSIIDALSKIKDIILRVHPTASSVENINVPLNIIFNSNFPAVSKKTILDFIDTEIFRLNNLNSSFSEDFLSNLDKIVSFIDNESTKIEALFNQSNAIFFDKIISIISLINITFQKYFDWEHVEDLKKVPREVKQRVLTVQQSLNEVEESSQEIQSKIKTINEAYDAATELPVLLEDLKRSRVDIDLVKNNSNTGYANIQSNKTRSENDLTSIQNTKQAAENLLDEAREILKQMQEKLTMSTSTGLAHAFSNRSDQLKKTSTWWTGGFIVSLIFTFLIAFNRFNDLKGTITQDTPISYVVIQILISLISLSAPVWFAIISSKQIQKLFTLSEDYAYKASISASYEGYRQEAYDVDADLVKKLLNTALTKVDEAPLRLVGKEQSSSPFEELINQPQIKQLLDEIPEAKDKLLRIFSNNESPDKPKKLQPVPSTENIEQEESKSA